MKTMKTMGHMTPEAVAELPTEKIHNHQIPVVTTGEVRASLTTLMRDISFTSAVVLLKQSERGRRAAGSAPKLDPVCYILATDVWKSVCESQTHRDLHPNRMEEQGTRELRQWFTEYALRAHRDGVHVTVGTKYASVSGWSDTFAPLAWGEEVIKRGLVTPGT